VSEKECNICPEWTCIKKEDYRGVWVFGEIYRGELHEASLQMLTPAREVANKLKTDVTGVIIGYKVKEEIKKEFIYHGADRVIVVDKPELETYYPDVYALTMASLATKYKPEMIFIFWVPPLFSLIPALCLLKPVSEIQILLEI